MKNFKQIDKCDVWPKLQDGKRVYAVCFDAVVYYHERGLFNLSVRWDVHDINHMLTEENVVFYEEIIEQQD